MKLYMQLLAENVKRTFQDSQILKWRLTSTVMSCEMWIYSGGSFCYTREIVSGSMYGKMWYIRVCPCPVMRVQWKCISAYSLDNGFPYWFLTRFGNLQPASQIRPTSFCDPTRNASFWLFVVWISAALPGNIVITLFHRSRPTVNGWLTRVGFHHFQLVISLEGLQVFDKQNVCYWCHLGNGLLYSPPKLHTGQVSGHLLHI